MGGDYSRSSFSALRDYAGVLMQQGHPTLDADWNEYVANIERRIRAGTVDTIGRAAVPRETPLGFEIQAGPAGSLRIGRGRIYVDGLLAENHGRIGVGAPPVLDRARESGDSATGVLDEPISSAANDFINFTAQPYFPGATLPTGSGPHLAYIDVWQREVTPLTDPRLLEPALGGIDTATRWQTVWQVRLLENVGTGTVCGSDIAAWDALVAPSPARLTNATIEFEDPEEPCLIPPGGGYRGLENQLFRVEIHRGGALGAAGFKWSRDNGSVGATIETFAAPDEVVVRRIGRDAVLRFRTGDWVEVTDDRREFAGLAGDMRRVDVDEDTNTLRFDAALSADLIPTNLGGDTAAAQHSRVVRWDQSGAVLRPDGSEWTNLDDAAADGLIPVPADGSPLVLEAGITVSFAVEVAGGSLRTGDFWTFAARTAGAQIEPLNRAPPHGVHHHYARLAVVTLPATVSDCRVFWPPLISEGEECGCTICVSAEGHNSGALTIEAAINQLPDEGGTVCLGPGDFVLGNTSVVIADKTSVRLRGHGPGSLLAYTGAGDALRIVNSEEVRISDLAVLAVPTREAATTVPGAATAIRVTNGISVVISRTVALVVGSNAREAFGIALDGFQIDLAVDDNLVVAPVGIGSISQIDGVQKPGYCSLMNAGIFGNGLVNVGAGAGKASYWAGFDLRGVLSLDLSHNTVSGIGPAGAPSPLIGVLLAGPMLAVDISANRILDNRAPADRGAYTLGRLREAKIRVSGNIISDGHDRWILPLVRVLADPQRTSGLTFTDNQCTLQADSPAKALAELSAPRVVAGNNIVRRRSELDAIHITCQVFGKDPVATVIGNITSGKIRLNGATLPLAFRPLNILSA